jgi:ATP-binding cassette subfamily B protein
MSERKIKYRQQRDVMGCGAACLSMITSYYGNPMSLEYVSSLCGMSIQGVSMFGIASAAQSIGFDTVGIKTSINALSSIPLPCILHWNQNHFVVLSKVDITKGKFEIMDPGEGRIKMSISTFTKHWIGDDNHKSNKEGLLLALRPGHTFFELKDDKSHNNICPNILIEYLNQYKSIFFQILIGLLLGCVLQLIMPFLTQWIVDYGIKYNDIKLIWLILVGELMIVCGRTATDFIRRWLLMHISMRINISLVSDFFIKLLKLPMSFFDTKLMGDLLQRINDHGRVQNFLTTQVLNIVFSVLSFIVFGTVLFIYNDLIFVIFIMGSIIYGIWIARFLSQRKSIDYELFGQQAINQNRTYQFITSIQEIKLQNCENRRRWEWEDTQADLFNVQLKSMKLQQTQEAGSIFINEIKNILITVFAATAVIDEQMSLGAMLAIQYIVGQLNSPIEQFMQFIYSFQDVKISLERINEIHGTDNEGKNSNSLSNFSKKGDIEIQGILFKYDIHALKNTLYDVTMSIPNGRVTAIVGASGSGKTTLIKLMLGYYKVLSGEIRIAGENINKYDLKWWRSHCGVVMQDGIIFSESIARNIAVDDGEIDINRMEDAAKLSCIHEYIMSLPLKYDTKIGKDGIGLSQGQKQRILIARAVYKDPDFIFLDEATNSLDAKNERKIVENLNNFYKGRTVIIVAHRLSTVKNADQIIVLEGGRVVEIGNHTSLIERKGAYYNLVKNQLELGK